MRSNYVQFNSPQFPILSDSQIEELHFATLQILERTGVAFESQESLNILGEAGADISNPDRVKIPSYLVDQALRKGPAVVRIGRQDLVGVPRRLTCGGTQDHQHHDQSRNHQERNAHRHLPTEGPARSHPGYRPQRTYAIRPLQMSEGTHTNSDIIVQGRGQP